MERLDPHYLLDTSVLARGKKPAIQPQLKPLIDDGLVARCAATDLEAGVMARNGDEHRAMERERSSWLVVEIDRSVRERAWQVQEMLADRGQHRGVKSFDLLIAAAAELANLVVLHYDRDYDRIADVTGQTVKWIVPAGSAD